MPLKVGDRVRLLPAGPWCITIREKIAVGDVLATITEGRGDGGRVVLDDLRWPGSGELMSQVFAGPGCVELYNSSTAEGCIPFPQRRRKHA